MDLRARWEYGQPRPEVEADIGPRRRRTPDDPAPPGKPSTPTGEPPAPPPR